MCSCPGCAALAPPDQEAAAGAPGGGGSVVYSSQSGKPIYDSEGVVHALTTFDGAAASAAWAGTTVTYSIASGDIATGQPGYRTEYDGYVEMTALQQQVAAQAFEIWDDVIAIDLVQVTDDPTANVLFNYSSTTSGNGTYASSSYSFAFTERADWALGKTHIWASNNWWTHDGDQDMYQGGYGVLTYLHEIGHALGLSHPGNYNGNGTFSQNASYHQDTRTYTVQSYFQADANGEAADHRAYTGAWRYGATPLLHDILTAQAIYGADMTTRTGNTVYGFNSNAGRDAFDFTKNNAPVIAIWDAGGIDTVDLSGFSENQVLTLVEGEFSNVGRQTMNFSIAYGAVVENAVGGTGNDRLTGNAAANLLQGGAGADTLFGGDGDDTLEGGTGADSLDGGAGNDLLRFTGATAGVTVNLLTGSHAGDAATDSFASIEAFEGTSFADSMTGDAATVLLSGLGGDDILAAGSGGTTLLGGDGNDTLTAGAGTDVIQGGNGTDRVSYAASAAGIQLAIGGTGIGGWAQGDIVTGIEHLIGTAFADTLTAAGTGTTIDGGNGDDSLFDGSGNAVLIGGLGNDIFNAGAGADTVQGGDGRDTMRYASAGAGVRIDLLLGLAAGSDAEGDTLTSIEDVVGSQHGDTLTGDGTGNRLEGLGGNDTIDGGAGDDTILGGDGADALTGGTGTDTAEFTGSTAGINVGFFRAGTGGAAQGDTLTGFERIVGSGFSDTLIGGGTGSVTLIGGAGNDLLYDYVANAVLDGGDGFDVIVGGAGTDTLFGGAGNDWLFGGSGADSIDGGTGTDWLSFAGAPAGVNVDLAAGTGTGGDAAGDTYAGIENVMGGEGADRLTGDGGFNQLSGGGGADTLDGGAGNDFLTGGAGADVFVFGAGWGRDLVLDFQDGIDLLDIRATGLGLANFTVVDTVQGTRLDWFDGTTTLAIHVFGADPMQIDSFDFVA